MQYEMEELVPLVAKLAEGYTSKESSSISYETAQQLMEAVLYCLQEAGQSGGYTPVQGTGLSAEKQYLFGARCVEEKTREALKLYNGLMNGFESYENRCLRDTVEKGLPEFFRWYDYRFAPQNTILTLDYPVLAGDLGRTGIDRIYDYVSCICLEQKFLRRFSTDYVIAVLSRHDKSYAHMIDNLCEIVLTSVLMRNLTGAGLSVLQWEAEEYKEAEAMLLSCSTDELIERLRPAVCDLVREYYENDEKLLEYLSAAVRSIAVRMRNAAESNHLSNVL